MNQSRARRSGWRRWTTRRHRGPDEAIGIAELFPRFYDARQSASAVRYVAQVDPMLLEDGTYFVLESGGEMVALRGLEQARPALHGSGDGEDDGAAPRSRDRAGRRCAPCSSGPDWTRRGLGRRILAGVRGGGASGKGFHRLGLMATLAGVPLYSAYGFRPLEEHEVVLEDGVRLGCVSMEKPIP